MEKNGDILSVRALAPTEEYLERHLYGTDAEVRVERRPDKSHVPYLYVRCFARNEKHAIKIANEKRTMIIATNQWR